MTQKTIDTVAESLAKKLELPHQERNREILKKFLKPCVVGQKTTASKTLSKIGGLPLLPKDFVLPLFDERPLQFFCQINFSEVTGYDIQKALPKVGMLVVFMRLKKENGDFTIPGYNPDHLKSFYF